MFAAAFWDRGGRRLTLARDRYGIKPLYLARAGNVLLFASEVKGLLAHGALTPALDPVGLAEYLTFQNFLTDRTLFRDVSLLPPATIFSIDAAGGERRRRYWDFRFDAAPDAPDIAVDELSAVFRRAVERQLVSDVPLGSYLSGGMDAGAITAIAASAIPNLCSFTVGFDLTSASGLELGFDERQTAERMSYLFRTEHYEMVLKAGDMERAMGDLVWHLEEPRVGQSYPNWYAAKLASRFGRVVLSGSGGDELFAGYPWRYFRTRDSDRVDDYLDGYYRFWQRLLPDEEHGRVLAPVAREVAGFDRRAAFRSVFGPLPDRLPDAADQVNRSLYFEARTFMHGVLTMEDKLSMGHSLESRVPFLDNDLVDLACRTPLRQKLAGIAEVVRMDENEPGPKGKRYFERTRDGKLIMRAMMRNYVPADIADGAKQGFSAPDASWFLGESLDYVRRRLLRHDARIYDVLDRAAVLPLLDEHLEGRTNRRLLIWSLLYLEEFFGCFLAGDGRAAGLARAPA
jgi:asparagine synthase (glutamine-hydrolysing)